MGLHRFKPMPSGRMGVFWTLAGISESAVVEFGCMGHNIYNGSALKREGVYEGKGADLYTTYIDETDIAMGDTKRLTDTVAQIVKRDKPKAIFLQPSAVPEVVGFDLQATALLLQDDYPDIPIIPVGKASFAISYHQGIQDALTSLVKGLPRECEKTEKPTYNLLGTCPDLFNYWADCIEIQRLLKGAFDMDSVCLLASDCTVTDIQNIPSAHINIVFRREALPAAKYLQKKFNMPYVYFRPYGIDGTTKALKEVGEVLGIEPDAEFTSYEETLALNMADRAKENLKNYAWSYPEDAVITLGGHADVVKGILEFATKEARLIKNIVWCDCPEHGNDDIPYFSEKQWAPAVQNHGKGFVMASGEALLWAKRNTNLQISKPDIGWRIHPYNAPFVGYHGAVNLYNIWVNERVLQS